MDEAIMKKELLAKIESENKDADLKLVEKAYDLAHSAHKGQKRKTGEDFFVHIYEVTEMLLSYNSDTDLVCAALLHDCTEDTDTSSEEIKEMFGEKIAWLVDAVTKVKIEGKSKEENKKLTIEKLIKFGGDDVRVFTLKFVDKLHNLQTLHIWPEERQKEYLKEIRDLYIPYAHNLGLGRIERELLVYLEKHKSIID